MAKRGKFRASAEEESLQINSGLWVHPRHKTLVGSNILMAKPSQLYWIEYFLLQQEISGLSYWWMAWDRGRYLAFGTTRQNEFMFCREKRFFSIKKIKGFFLQRKEVRWDFLFLNEEKNGPPHKIFLYHPDETRIGLEVQTAGDLIKDTYLCVQGVIAQEQKKTSEEASLSH